MLELTLPFGNNFLKGYAMNNTGKKIVIYGASTIGVAILKNAALDYDIICLVDRDVRKQSAAAADMGGGGNIL